jgi:hypothetical protein
MRDAMLENVCCQPWVKAVFGIFCAMKLAFALAGRQVETRLVVLPDKPSIKIRATLANSSLNDV